MLSKNSSRTGSRGGGDHDVTRRSGVDSDFYHRVYETVMEIPMGCVTSYGAIAAHLGARSSSRLVGYALMMLVGDSGIPCHRVVNRIGLLSGSHHFATPTLMRELLDAEGVEFKGEAVVMEKHFWDPATGKIGLEKKGRSRK
jgi:methylated-DNA-protein-cysteine methyltransferase-like protein